MERNTIDRVRVLLAAAGVLWRVACATPTRPAAPPAATPAKCGCSATP